MVPTVRRLGKLVVEAAIHNSSPTETPGTVVLVIVKYKSYSFVAPVLTPLLATTPVVFPEATTTVKVPELTEVSPVEVTWIIAVPAKFPVKTAFCRFAEGTRLLLVTPPVILISNQAGCAGDEVSVLVTCNGVDSDRTAGSDILGWDNSTGSVSSRLHPDLAGFCRVNNDA